MQPATTQFDSSWRSLLTGGFGSLLLHLGALVLVSISLRGCQKASSGTPGGEPFRDVGLFVVDGVEGGATDDGAAPGKGEDQQTQPSQDQIADSSNTNDSADGDAKTSERLPSEAPDVSELLNISEATSPNSGTSNSTLPPLIGPGDPLGGVRRPIQGGGGRLIQPSESGGAAKLGGVGGVGDTTFMNISGVGTSFVYVIDTSSSMYGDRLKIAQSQLKKSLRMLQPNQKFGVIFYNESRTNLQLPGQNDRKMFFATELNKQQAARQVDRVVSDAGTEHKIALLEALSLKPDVIYFLTDGAEPELSAADLAEIARRTGSTTIHVVQFGDGTVSSRETNWLERLARQSRGEFREIKAIQ
jgi:Ca-activated chloride channel family protein